MIARYGPFAWQRFSAFGEAMHWVYISWLLLPVIHYVQD